MPVTRQALAAAALLCAAAAGDARADDGDVGSMPPAAQEASVGVGIGTMTTTDTLGDSRVAGLSFSGGWFPGNGHFGARLHLGFAAIEGGTSYVNSERLSNLVTALGTARLHMVGPFYGYAGAGAGAVLMRSRHRALLDEMVVWTTHPAITWTAGIELAHQQVFVRADHVGAWHDMSRDMLYSVHVGMAF